MPSNRFRAVQNVKIEGEKGSGDSGNCPGAWPNLCERRDVLNIRPPGGDA